MHAFGLAAAGAPLLLSHFSDRHRKPRDIMVMLFLAGGIIAPFWQLRLSLYPTFLITVLFFGCLVSVIGSIDSYAHRFLKEVGKEPSHIVKLRIWGSISFMLPGTVIWLTHQYLTIEVGNVLWLAALSSLVAAFAASKLPLLEHSPQLVKVPGAAAIKFIWTSELRTVFIAMAITGIGLAMMYILMPLILYTRGYPASTVAIASNIGVLSEIMFMPFAPALCKRLGENRVLLLGMLALALRLCIFATSDNLYIFLASQALHSFTIISFFVVMPMLIAAKSAANFRFSVQALYVMLILGVMRIFGAWLVAIDSGSFGTSPLNDLKASSLLAGSFALIGAGIFAVYLFRTKAVES